MDKQLRKNAQSISLVLGVLLLVIVIANLSADPAAVGGLLLVAALLLLYGVAGHRLVEFTSSLFGAKFNPVDVADEAKRVVRERPIVERVEGTGHIVLPAVRVSGRGHVEQATTDASAGKEGANVANSTEAHAGKAGATARAHEAEVITESFTVDAVIAAEKALDEAKTPAEFADRMVDYVRTTDGAELVEYLASLQPEELELALKEFRGSAEPRSDDAGEDSNGPD